MNQSHMCVHLREVREEMGKVVGCSAILKETFRAIFSLVGVGSAAEINTPFKKSSGGSFRPWLQRDVFGPLVSCYPKPAEARGPINSRSKIVTCFLARVPPPSASLAMPLSRGTRQLRGSIDCFRYIRIKGSVT